MIRDHYIVCTSGCTIILLLSFGLQGPICRSYMDPLTLSAWTCFLSSLQSAVVAFLLLPDRSAWKVHSLFELSCYIFAVSTHTHTHTHTQSFLQELEAKSDGSWLTGSCRARRNAGRVRVGRGVLPAVVVHLGEGPALLGHVQPALHRHHHRVRGDRSPGGAARRQV